MAHFLSPKELAELPQKNYQKAKRKAAKAEKNEKKKLAERQRRKNVKQGVQRTVEPGTVTCEIRPAHWCNICNRAFHSNKEMKHHAGHTMHKRGLKQLSAKALANILHVSPNLGQPYGEGTAQFGYAEGKGFYCFLCRADVGDGLALDAHLIDQRHLDKLAKAAPVKGAPDKLAEAAPVKGAPDEAAPLAGNAGGGAGGNVKNEIGIAPVKGAPDKAALTAGNAGGGAGGNVKVEVKEEMGVAT